MWKHPSLSLQQNYNASINSSGAHPPPPPGQPLGICSRCQWGGAFAILSWLWGLGISIPGRPLGIWHTCFRKTDKFIGKDETFVKDWLVHQGLEKLVDVPNFRYFFITCKHINISYNVKYILFISRLSLTWTLRGHNYFAFRIQNYPSNFYSLFRKTVNARENFWNVYCFATDQMRDETAAEISHDLTHETTSWPFLDQLCILLCYEVT